MEEIERMKRAYWYNLPLSRDERKIIYSKLEFIEWILARMAHDSTYHPILKDIFFHFCAINGYLELLQWSNPPNDNVRICSTAALNGHLHIIQWARLRGMTWNEKRIMQIAIEKGNLELVKWLRSQNVPWHRRICEKALRHGHYALFRWCVEQCIPMDDRTRNLANEKGLLV